MSSRLFSRPHSGTSDAAAGQGTTMVGAKAYPCQGSYVEPDGDYASSRPPLIETVSTYTYLKSEQRKRLQPVNSSAAKATDNSCSSFTPSSFLEENAPVLSANQFEVDKVSGEQHAFVEDDACVPAVVAQVLKYPCTQRTTTTLPRPIDLSLYRGLRLLAKDASSATATMIMAGMDFGPTFPSTKAVFFELNAELVGVLGIPEIGDHLLVHEEVIGNGEDHDDFRLLRSRFVATALVLRLLRVFEAAAEEQAALRPPGKDTKGKKGKGKGKVVKGENGEFLISTKGKDNRPHWHSKDGEKSHHSYGPTYHKQSSTSLFSSSTSIAVDDNGLPLEDTPSARKMLYAAALNFSYRACRILIEKDHKEEQQGTSDITRDNFEQRLHEHNLSQLHRSLRSLDHFLGKMSLLRVVDSALAQGPISGKTSPASIRWSQFGMWHLLAPHMMSPLPRRPGGDANERKDLEFIVLTPRFFLVDLACSADSSPFSIEKQMPLVVDDRGRVFIGQWDKFDDREYHDGMRQGYHFESQILADHEGTPGARTHLLTTLTFPQSGVRCVYSCAPDFAIKEKLDELGNSHPGQGKADSLESFSYWCAVSREREQVSDADMSMKRKEMLDWVKTGLVSNRKDFDRTERTASSSSATSATIDNTIDSTYQKDEKHDVRMEIGGSGTASSFTAGGIQNTTRSTVNVWRRNADNSGTATAQHLPSGVFGELKKTTHLFGRGGAIKKLKFWLQAYLGGIDVVAVGLNDRNRADVVSELSCFRTEELVEDGTKKRTLARLEDMLMWLKEQLLRHKEHAVSGGVYTFKVLKDGNFAREVRLELHYHINEAVPSFIRNVFLDKNATT
ncbi:unnamed protein product [Amoebophrya sp. A25]|nr:unnamed protein product [Amoebophrya sp. A25]|eukprot:GSA25T00000029001.1